MVITMLAAALAAASLLLSSPSGTVKPADTCPPAPASCGVYGGGPT